MAPHYVECRVIKKKGVLAVKKAGFSCFFKWVLFILFLAVSFFCRFENIWLRIRYFFVAYFDNCALIMRIEKGGIVLYLDSSS